MAASSSPFWWDSFVTYASPGPEQYRVTVKTGSHGNAGTDVGYIYLKLIGSRIIGTKIGSDHRLDIPNIDDRLVGAEDVYTLREDRNLGDIRKIQIWSTGEHEGDDGWLLESVSVEELSTGERWQFNCKKWIDTDSREKTINVLLSEKNGCS